MANDKVMPEGIRVFDKHANAPDFVVCSVVVTPDDLLKFCNENGPLMSDYQGKPQLRLQLLKSQAGKLYMAVDTYKKQEGGAQPGYAPTIQRDQKPTDIVDHTLDLPF